MKNNSQKAPFDYYSHEQLRKKWQKEKEGWVEIEDNTDTAHGVEFQEDENKTVEAVWNGSSSDI